MLTLFVHNCPFWQKTALTWECSWKMSSLTCCVAWQKSVNLSKPLFPPLWNEANSSPHLPGLSWDFTWDCIKDLEQFLATSKCSIKKKASLMIIIINSTIIFILPNGQSFFFRGDIRKTMMSMTKKSKEREWEGRRRGQHGLLDMGKISRNPPIKWLQMHYRPLKKTSQKGMEKGIWRKQQCKKWITSEHGEVDQAAEVGSRGFRGLWRGLICCNSF